MHQNKKQPPVIAPLILGIVLIGLWILGVKAFENPEARHILHPSTIATNLFFPLLVIGVVLIGLGAIRLLHASWNRNNSTNATKKNTDL